MAAEPQVLDLLRADFARMRERLDRIDSRLGELTTRPAAAERRLSLMEA